MIHTPKTVSLAEAQRIILTSVTPLGPESIHIFKAVKRFLYEDIVADNMIPPMDSSARDGYAVIAEDTYSASQDTPVQLKVVGEIQAGALAEGKQVSTGTAIRIMTGAPIPPGADAVVQFEDTLEQDGYVNIFRRVDRYENYRCSGENIKKGEKVLLKGDRLNAADVGILASVNRDAVEVYRRPTVAVISTGDELAPIGQKLEPGKVRDVNAYALCAEVAKCNALPKPLGIAKDSLQEVRQLLDQALDADVILSTGGGSMGKYDFVKDAYADLRVQMKFYRVNVKPGKPCSFGVLGNKLFFSLPGNPVSAMTSFIQFVRPALLSLMGAQKLFKPVAQAILDEPINKKPTKNLRLLRGCFSLQGGEFHVSTTGDQKSSVFKSMRDANCLIIVPENSGPLKAGEKVRIQLIYHEEIAVSAWDPA
ncbi:MAG: molybdopterin molybdotransferase MoeA [Deltaproteobacteria bacterium]|nr:molybdopterin molybdotransferase MoeA [Deltaproteobacteria bacterium]